MKAYDDRFSDAVQDALGDRFKVENSQGLIIAQHADGAVFTMWPHGRDRRRPVDPLEVRRAIDAALATARRNMSHYTPKAAAEVAAMLLEVSP